MTENNEKIESEKEKFKKVMSMSEYTGINIHEFISKGLREELSKKFKNKIFFPILGIAFEEDKKFIFLFHPDLESIDKNKVIIMNLENITKSELTTFFDFVNKYRKGD